MKVLPPALSVDKTHCRKNTFISHLDASSFHSHKMLMLGDANTIQQASSPDVTPSASAARNQHNNSQDSHSLPKPSDKFLQNLAGVAGNVLEWYDFGKYSCSLPYKHLVHVVHRIHDIDIYANNIFWFDFNFNHLIQNFKPKSYTIPRSRIWILQ